MAPIPLNLPPELSFLGPAALCALRPRIAGSPKYPNKNNQLTEWHIPPRFNLSGFFKAAAKLRHS
jgi:hypothetical protein